MDKFTKTLEPIPDLLPETAVPAEITFAAALKVVTEVMREGARTHPDNDWLEQTPEHHVKRAMIHLSLWLHGNPANQRENLSHAATRLLMALTLE